MAAKVLGIERIGLVVADLGEACAFYEQRLGFAKVASEVRVGAAFAQLTGVADAAAEVAVLGLGAQAIELIQFARGGRAYPTPRTAADPWFQHIAIVTADMARAYHALGDVAPAISSGGPQALPASSGSVTAYKFRDPEGHPLELSWFPAGAAPQAWRHPPGDAVFLGIDHSGLVISDMEASVAFYVGLLGLTERARQVNKGPEQDRLDGVADARVNIVSLAFADAGPHIELLAYANPRWTGTTTLARADDIAATRLVVGVRGLEELAAHLRDAGGRFVSDGLVEAADDSRRALARDPDGHLIEFVESA